MGLSPGSKGRVRPVLFVSGCRHAARAGFFGCAVQVFAPWRLPDRAALSPNRLLARRLLGLFQRGGAGRLRPICRLVEGGSGRSIRALSVLPQRGLPSAGGHESIRAEVLDHDRLAARFRLAGMPSVTRLGGGLLAFRMYSGGWRETSMGWAKSIALGAGGSARSILLLTVLWISGLAGAAIGIIQALANLPLAGVTEGGTSLIAPALLYLLAVWSCRRVFRHAGSFGWAAALLYPAVLLYFCAVFSYALYRSYVKRSVKWKGRDIDVA